MPPTLQISRNQPVIERQQRREISSTAYVNLVRDYDAVGNRVQTLVNFRGTLSGQTVSGGVTDLINSYQFDGLDRLVSVTQRGNLDAQGNLLQASNGVAPKTASFQYDAASQLTDMRRYASTGIDASQLKVHSRMGYDGAGRLQSITHGKVEIAAGEHWNGSSTLPSSLGSTHMLAGYYFAYDTANRLTSFASQRDRFETSYGYDNRHQLTSTTSTAIAGMGTPDVLPPNEGYAWDATGNRLGSSGQSQSATGTHNRLQSDGTYSYLYDNEGNVTRRTEIATSQVRTFTWDHRNRLTRVIDYETLGGTLTQDTLYYYDAFDRLVAKRINDNGVSGYNRYESWVWDGQEIAIQLRDADGAGSSQPYRIVNRYLYGPAVDMVLADERYEDGVGYRPTATTREVTQGQSLWTLTDHLGSVRDLVDNAGVVRRHVVYDSFGGRLHEQNYNASGQPISPLDSAAVDTIFGYTGRQWDRDVELQYNRARWYDPQTGRWLSQDPIGFAAGDANLYRYVGNKPTTYLDPNGLEEITIGSNVPFSLLKKILGLNGTVSVSHRAAIIEIGGNRFEFDVWEDEGSNRWYVVPLEDGSLVAYDSLDAASKPIKKWWEVECMKGAMTMTLAAAELGTMLSGESIGRSIPPIPKSGQVVDLMGGTFGSYGGKIINFDLKAINGIRDDVINFGKHFPRQSVRAVIANNPRAEFLPHILESLKHGAVVTVRGNRSNKFVKKILDGKAEGLEHFNIVVQPRKIQNNGFFCQTDGRKVIGEIWEIVLQKK